MRPHYRIYKLIDIKDARVYIHQTNPRTEWIYTVIFHAAAAFTTLFIYTRTCSYIYINVRTRECVYKVISFSLYLFIFSLSPPKSLSWRAAVNFPLVNEAPVAFTLQHPLAAAVRTHTDVTSI